MTQSPSSTHYFRIIDQPVVGGHTVIRALPIDVRQLDTCPWSKTLENIEERTAMAWGDFVEEHIEAGWSPYLLTFMFEPLPGSQTARMQLMATLLEAAFAIFVTRVVRRPRQAACQGRLPIWLCSPDIPVFKRSAKLPVTFRDPQVNEGLHMHAILLLPPWTRLLDVASHFEMLRGLYRERARLDRVHVEPITHDARYVVGYGYKQIMKRHFEVGDHFVLPMPVSELPA